MDQAYEPELAVASSNIILPEFAAMPVIDSASMSCRFRICTPREDREGEIIEPSGVDWSDYQFAPTVKYEHGLTGVPFPVARSADSNGMLHVNFEFDEDAIYARAFHSEDNELSYQTFGLIEEGFIRAASIHVLPIQFTRRGNTEDSPVHAQTSQMLEWSECTVGVNPDAYAKALTSDSRISEVLNLQLEAGERILAAGTIGGRRLVPTLAKCLNANKPPRTVLGTGTEFDKGNSSMAKTLTKEQVEGLTVIGLAKAVSDPASYDADTMKLLRFRAKSLDDESLKKMQGDSEDTLDKAAVDPDAETLGKADPEPEAETTEPTAPSRPMGAEVLAAMHGGVTDLLGNCEEALKAVENPQVTDFVSASCDVLREQVAAIEGAYSSIYPEAPGLSSGETEATEEMVKSWIASNAMHSFQLEGLANRLDGVLQHGVEGKAKSLVSKTSGDLRLLIAKAKSFTPKPVADQANEQRIARLEKAVNKLVDTMGKKPAQLPTS